MVKTPRIDTPIRYLYVGVDEVGAAGQTNTLPTSLAEMLDSELPTLLQS